MITSSRTVTTRLLVAATALAAAFALAGCAPAAPTVATGSSAGGSTTPTTAPTPSAASDSCSVVTVANVSTALGETVRAGVRGKATVEGGVACVFYGPSVAVGTNPDVPVTNSVRVVLVTGTNGTKWFNDYKSKVPFKTLSGLGDQAFYDGSASVSVLKGDSYLRISVIKARGADEAAEVQLAMTALPNF